MVQVVKSIATILCVAVACGAVGGEGLAHPGGGDDGPAAAFHEAAQCRDAQDGRIAIVAAICDASRSRDHGMEVIRHKGGDEGEHRPPDPGRVLPRRISLIVPLHNERYLCQPSHLAQ